MNENFCHKGLLNLYTNNSIKGVNAEHEQKIRDILSVLDSALFIEEVDLPTFKLHSLKGDLKSFWSVTVRANWQIIFRFENGIVSDVDLVDYH